MKNIEHVHPERSEAEGKDTLHRLELMDDGQKVGFAELEYRNDPFPYYYVVYLEVKEQSRGQGYGRDVLRALNDFLDQRGRTGILTDTITPNSPAAGMYARNNWEPIVGQDGWYIHNPPKNIGDARIQKALFSIQEAA